MLEIIIDWLVYNVLGLSRDSLIGQSINFFIYDSVKIIFLLFLMVAIMGFLRTYIPQNKVRKWLSGKKKGMAHVAVALFGAATPFCSCSSIPIFISFLEMGVPLGVTFSFLITSPLINEYLVVLMLGFFGWKITLLYVLFGLLIGVGAGLILGAMNLEKNLVKNIFNHKPKKSAEKKYFGIKDRILFGLHESKSILKRLWLWILFAVGISAIIHNYIPQEFIQGVMEKGGVLTVPIAVLIGVPLYGSCAAIVPIAVELFQKGIPLGSVLAFMMAMAALSLPEAVILRRVMNLKLIAIFFGIVAIGIIIIGYLFNFMQPLLT